MLQEPINQFSEAILRGKTRVAATATALGAQYQEHRKRTGGTKQNPLSLVARLNKGTLILQWRLLEGGKVKELGAKARISQKWIVRVPEQHRGLVLQTEQVAESYRKAWTRLCYLGKKLAGAQQLAGLRPWLELQPHLSRGPRRAVLPTQPDGDSLADDIQQMEQALQYMKARLAGEAPALAAYWVAEKKIIEREQGGRSEETRCPAFLNVETRGTLRMRWFTAHKHPTGLGTTTTKFKPLGRRDDSKFPEKLARYVPGPFMQTWMEVDARQKEISRVWAKVTELDRWVRAMKMARVGQIAGPLDPAHAKSIKSSLPPNLPTTPVAPVLMAEVAVLHDWVQKR